MKQLYQKPSITKDTLVHFESIYTASGSPTIPDPTPSIEPPCNGNNNGRPNNGNNGNHNGNNNGNNNGRPHRPGGRG